MATKKKAAKKASKRAAAPGRDASPSAISITSAILKKGNEPYLTPPDLDSFAIWNNSKKVVQTWGKAQDKNAWLNISDLGWRRIRDVNESSMLAILLIGAHARDKGTIVNVRTEADNKIYEIYAW